MLKLDTIEKRLDLAYEMRQGDLEPITPHLIGPPGVGKSTIVKEYAETKAKRLQKQFVDFDTLTPEDVERLLETPDKYYVFADKRLTGMDPIDISGIPRAVNDSKYVMFVPLALAKLLSKSAGLLFLDEFLNENRPNMMSCLPPGEPILGLKPKTIENMSFGDVVLAQNGLAVVTTPFSRDFEGELCEIRALGLLPLRLTPEHPILVGEAEIKHFRYPNKPSQYGRRKKIKSLSWKKTEDVKKGDYLVFPKLKLETDIATADINGWNLKARKDTLVEKLPLNEGTARLIGYYVSEGSRQIDFGKHEQALAEDVQGIVNEHFPFKCTITARQSTLRVTFGNRTFWRFLHENCGRRAPNKCIPPWILYNEKSLLAAFLKAYFKGDGCNYEPSKQTSTTVPTITASTASKTLALQIQQAFSRFGVLAKLYEQQPHDPSFINGKLCHPKEKVYTVQITDSKGYSVLGLKRKGVKREIQQFLEDEDYFYLPIRSNKRVSYKGKVHNIETTSHTYVVSNAVVHNCAYKIVRDYKIGDIALNKQTLVVAASNSAEHSSISNSIPKPLRDRFDFIEAEPPTVESWVEWMDKRYGPANWERNVLAYLHWRPSDFLANTNDTVEDNGYEPPATPRGWSYVSLAFTKVQDPEMRASIAKGKLGRVGETLLAFLANKVPPFEELIAQPEVIAGFNIEQKYLAALTVAEAITQANPNIQKSKKFLCFVAEKDDRELISALFAFLQKQRRREVFVAVKDKPQILKALELTGKALL